MTEPTLNFQIKARQTQFRIPTELRKKNFKHVQKLIEKQKRQTMEDIKKLEKNSLMPTSMKLEMVRKCIKSFEQYQVKLKQAIKKDEEYCDRLNARVDNLVEVSNYTLDGLSHGAESNDDSLKLEAVGTEDQILDFRNPSLISWFRNEADLLIADYLIKTAKNPKENIGLAFLNRLKSTTFPQIDKLIDFDLFEQLNKVYVSIVRDHDLTLVVNWFNDNRTLLKKINSNLEFEINYCKFLSLVESKQLHEAVKFSEVNLSPYGIKANYQISDLQNYENNLAKLKENGGLLLFLAVEQNSNSKLKYSHLCLNENQRFQEYRKVFSKERWESLSRCFVDNFTTMYGIPKNYPLFIYLSAGLASLKTKSCYRNHANSIFNQNVVSDQAVTDRTYYLARGPNNYYKLLEKVNECPVCSPELYQLSNNLPYAQLITSVFNEPYVLPNNNIYPFEKLSKLAAAESLLHTGQIRDPLTLEQFYVEQCFRVYPA
ncbi:GID complex subunit containing RING finger motif [Scheffersomyces spartinae]|uniref:GID complex subunit containing RING finger motif n=1 Tax=Scheffersomyces spartinae TaxID=45513 RepID=A0A9P7V993_9ASCO|nr:GID complex subunit containing RING finger motif [Scheffersomyces spartinae]KAG7193400.1 GID complex subunit containing RING finger motif [Scheffersomyces spartinae]